MCVDHNKNHSQLRICVLIQINRTSLCAVRQRCYSQPARLKRHHMTPQVPEIKDNAAG